MTHTQLTSNSKGEEFPGELTATSTTMSLSRRRIPSKSNIQAWQDYHDTVDELKHTRHLRNFQQIVGEHACHLLRTGINYGNRQQSCLWDDSELLTDLSHEWHNLATRSSDPPEFKQIGVAAVRAPARCAKHLIAARIDKHGDRIVEHHQAQLAGAVQLALQWHSELDGTNSAVHSSLGDMWLDYYSHLDAAIAALAHGGPESTEFYRRGTAFLRIAQAIGGCLDLLTIK